MNDRIIDIKKQYFYKILCEKEDLKDKINALNDLFDNHKFDNISEEQILLLDIQLKVMNTYYEVLAQRYYLLSKEINALKKDE